MESRRHSKALIVQHCSIQVCEEFGEVYLGLVEVVREGLIEVIVDVWWFVSVPLEPCLEIMKEAGV